MQVFQKTKFLVLLILNICVINVFNAQVTDTTEQLPFKISHLKKLDSLELADKREGTFVTGIPDLSDDPINGFGYGVEGSITFNGKRDNPFFAYTPYLTQLNVVLFNTSRNQREFVVSIDKPYLFKTKWRLRGEAAYEINPNLLYFGLTGNTLNTLSAISTQDGVSPNSSNNYEEYSNGLTGAYQTFNTYTKEEYILNVSGEYSMMDSKMRLLIGGELAGLNITTANDTASRLQRDKQNSNILGVGKSTVVFLQAGLIYDTRDFEPDPNKGVFAEVTNEWSNQAFGSAYNCDKVFGQVKWYKKLLPNRMQKMIFATRFGMGYTFGAAPFFEYQDEWSSEGSIEGLGGANTLRGYKQSRFLDRGQVFWNTELRTRFMKFSLLKQDIVLSAVPFFDLGTVYSKPTQIFESDRLRYNEGMGLRVAWNLSTILRFDYAVSKEDHQFFFTFGHAF